MEAQDNAAMITKSETEIIEHQVEPKSNQIKSWLKDVDVLTYVLIMCFAISSWIDINGLWVEMPLLVNDLPEQWSLPSFIVIIIQIANIGPFVYTIANKLAPRTVHEIPVVYVIIGVGAASTLLLVHFWDHTSHVRGKEHSTALLTLTGFLSLVDCTSSVVFLPYMQRFKPQYMSALYIGEGLSGLVPGLVGLGQGVGANPTCVNSSAVTTNSSVGINTTTWNVYPVYPPPKFSVQAFFWLLFAILCLSCAAFTVLNYLPRCKKAYAVNYITTSCSVTKEDQLYRSVSQNDSNASLQQQNQNPTYGYVHCVEHATTNAQDAQLYTEKLSDYVDRSARKKKIVYLLIVTAWVCAWTNGILPSTQTYSCLPYGKIPRIRLHLLDIIFNVFN